MKVLPYISVLVAIVIVISELAYVGTDSNLAWIIIGLAAAVAMNGIALFDRR